MKKGPTVGELYGEKISELVREGIEELSNKITKQETTIETLQQNQENEKKPLGRSLFSYRWISKNDMALLISLFN